MTPKEKAQELFETMNEISLAEYSAQQCALIAVSMVIQEVYNISHQHTAIYDEKVKFYRYEECKELKYWKEIKAELENL